MTKYECNTRNSCSTKRKNIHGKDMFNSAA